MRRFFGLWIAAVTTCGAAWAAYGQAPDGAAPKGAAAAPRAGAAGNKAARAPEKIAQKPGGAPRKDAAKPATPPPDPKRMQELLLQWEKQSAKNKSLNASFTRLDTSAVWDDKMAYVGRAALMSPNRAFLRFDKVVPGKTPDERKYELHEVIMCNGEKVYQFLYDRKQIFVFPLDPQARQRALQEGPLPFLFDMKSEEAKQRYNFTLIEENDAKCLIRVEPRQKIDREAFSVAYIWLDKETFMPTKLRLDDPNNGKDKKEFTFTKLDANAKVDESSFDGATLARKLLATTRGTKNPWELIENPDAQSQAQGAPRPKANGARPMQPAARQSPGRRQ
jgi:TIGR03009 family protein